MINLTDSDHAEGVCVYILYVLSIYSHLQKDGTDNPQFENCISEVSPDVQNQYTNDGRLSIFQAEYTEEV